MPCAVTLQVDILPKLGRPKVPTDAIASLAQALRDASRLHQLALDWSEASLASPSLTAASSGQSLNRKPAAAFVSASDFKSRSSSDGTLDGTTIDDEELPRERFAYWCLDLLFHMCTRAQDGEYQKGFCLIIN